MDQLANARCQDSRSLHANLLLSSFRKQTREALCCIRNPSFQKKYRQQRKNRELFLRNQVDQSPSVFFFFHVPVCVRKHSIIISLTIIYANLRDEPIMHCVFLVVTLFTLLLSISVSAMTISKVAVIGATGKLGRLTVQNLVNQGIECKILARNLPSTNNDEEEEVVKDLKDATTRDQVVAYLASQPGVSFVEGDVSNVDALTELCKDCQACIAVYGSTRKSQLSDIWSNPEDTDKTHAKQVNYQGVINLIEACKASKSCQRIVRITGKGEDPNGIFSVLINMLGSMAKAWNYEGERALRGQSDIDYTIIRPGIMSEEGQEEGSSLSLGDDGADLPVAKISYGDIANLCVDCLEYDNTARTTLTAMTTPPEEGKSPITSWKPMLETVEADRRKFPDDMLQQHYDAVKGALLKLGAFSAVFLAVLVKFIFF